MREGLGMDKIMLSYISPDLMFSITLISVMHFHNHLCNSISPKILKEIFAIFLYYINQQISFSRINKPPWTFKAGEAV